ncbi:hypothetical protein ACHAXN_011372 [Cyclotella atomus]|jgi:hypothetical protein
MSISELVVFGILGASVTAGLFQIGSDALRVYKQNDGDSPTNNKSALSAACPINWGKKDT